MACVSGATKDLKKSDYYRDGAMKDKDESLSTARQRRERVERLRREYAGDRLSAQNLPTNPLDLFGLWFEQAIETCVEPNAMVLSTVGDTGPSSRVVLLKGVDDVGLTFYTNYRSRKGRELLGHPLAALNFFWVEFHRQVRIEGRVAKADSAVSDRYFASRPRESQLGAWASPQSSEIGSRSVLDTDMESVRARFADVESVPRPPHWGGFTLSPARFEFWQGQESRVHDRNVYRCGPGGWARSRLAP